MVRGHESELGCRHELKAEQSAVGWLQALQIRVEYLTLVAEGLLDGSTLILPKTEPGSPWRPGSMTSPGTRDVPVGTLICFVVGDNTQLVDVALNRILGFMPAKQLQDELSTIHSPDALERLLVAINRVFGTTLGNRQLFISPLRIRLLHGLRQQLGLLFCLSKPGAIPPRFEADGTSPGRTARPSANGRCAVAGRVHKAIPDVSPTLHGPAQVLAVPPSSPVVRAPESEIPPEVARRWWRLALRWTR